MGTNQQSKGLLMAGTLTLTLMTLIVLVGVIYAFSGNNNASEESDANANLAPALQSEQETSEPTEEMETFAYFIAPDAAGVSQVWALSLTDGATQITQSPVDILSFGVQANGEAVVYNTFDIIWYQQIGSADAREVATLQGSPDTTDRYAEPSISPDGNTISYADDGLYLVSSQGGPPQLLVENIRNMGDIQTWRYVRGADFVSNDLLLANIGIWEGSTPATIDANTGAYVEAPRYAMPFFTQISDNRLVLYSPSFMGLRSGLEIAPLDDITSPQPLLDRSLGMAFDQDTITVDVVETQPNNLRLLVEWIDVTSPGASPQRMILDYDMVAGTSTQVDLTQTGFDINVLLGLRFSPDGRYLIGYADGEVDFETTNAGLYQGSLVMIDLTTGEQLVLANLPEPISQLTFN